MLETDVTDYIRNRGMLFYAAFFSWLFDGERRLFLSFIRDNEAEMIDKIARDISDKLNATPSRDFDGMVGLDAHLKEMESLLDLDYDGAKIVGISSPAGIGKSTIARALQSRLSNRFHHTFFPSTLGKTIISVLVSMV